ncbi:DUF2225 domain-containing protein [bacterium]|nr:DUF2225 domain-containing protein [bacterium]
MKNLFLMIILTVLIFSLTCTAEAQKFKPQGEKKEKGNHELMQKIHGYMQMGDAYRRLAKLSEKKEDYKKAIGYLNELLPLFDKVTSIIKHEEKKKHFEMEKVDVQMRIGELYLKSGQEDKAKQYIEGLLSSGKVPERALPSIYLKLSKYYEKKNDLEKAEEMLLKSLAISKKIMK